MNFKLLGVGSPLVDYFSAVSDAFLNKTVPEGKGCTRSISRQERSLILEKCPSIHRSPGGSAANTVRAFAELGGKAALFGKLSRDEDGSYFRDELKKSGANDSLLLETDLYGTGYCLSLITPDAERTMLSDLAASRKITLDELELVPFSDFNIMLLEGYLALENWSIPLLEKARKSNVKIALDLNNYELVSREKSRFQYIIGKYVDILFANEEEICSLTGTGDPQDIRKEIRHPDLIIVKQGDRGSLWITDGNCTEIAPVKISNVKDTTGAGDFYAAGAIYGIAENLPVNACGYAASLCAAEVIKQNGTLLNGKQWDFLRKTINDLKTKSI